MTHQHEGNRGEFGAVLADGLASSEQGKSLASEKKESFEQRINILKPFVPKKKKGDGAAEKKGGGKLRSDLLVVIWGVFSQIFSEDHADRAGQFPRGAVASAEEPLGDGGVGWDGEAAVGAVPWRGGGAENGAREAAGGVRGRHRGEELMQQRAFAKHASAHVSSVF